MSFITSIGTALPPHQLTQTMVADFMIKAMDLNEQDSRILKALHRNSGIQTRHSVLPDYGKTQSSFFPGKDGMDSFPSTKKRMELYRQHAAPLSMDAIERCLKGTSFHKKEITHLIVVSCTGMYAPGLDIDIVNQMGLNSGIHRTCINFMGCYAAFNAIRIADSICRSDHQAKVLIVCTELCSIHFQRENTPDNLLANTLFADGAAAVLMQSQPLSGINLKTSGFYCALEPRGANDMGWLIGDYGFEMKLSSEVPHFIGDAIPQLTSNLLSHYGLNGKSIRHYAIHPGGKKILEVITKVLGLDEQATKHSMQVLKSHGNMSSPTVLFVIDAILKTLTPQDEGHQVLSFAFGPGLTLESMILTIHFQPK